MRGDKVKEIKGLYARKDREVAGMSCPYVLGGDWFGHIIRSIAVVDSTFNKTMSWQQEYVDKYETRLRERWTPDGKYILCETPWGTVTSTITCPTIYHADGTSYWCRLRKGHEGYHDYGRSFEIINQK